MRGASPSAPSATGRQEASRAEACTIKTLIDRGGDPLGDVTAARTSPSVGDLCDRFIAEYLARKKPSTEHTYKLQIKAEIRPALGKLKVAEVTFSDVDGLHRKLTARGVSDRANRVIALLSATFTMAIKWRMRTDNPCKGIERNTEYKRRRYLSPDELARLTMAATWQGSAERRYRPDAAVDRRRRGGFTAKVERHQSRYRQMEQARRDDENENLSK